ncbi:uncharacterized protein [Halyomorpha halys]|uniref:uncharacterized protein isoform X2 n=1 Tax=Halyomorpha halys TaxID=286706 RepID=UPI0006D50234|nr:uncharacterized protein LOC106686316 [Halyomorpha halys]
MLKANTPQKTALCYPQFSLGGREVPPDNAVQEIIMQEYKYKRELWRLQKILRRSMSSDDPLPMFNRRHLLILIKRLCKDMEYSTSRMNKEMDMSRLSHVLEHSTQVQHNLLCVAYTDTLFEVRELLRRETTRRNDSSICYCTEIHGERALLPLHRLRYLKALSCFPQYHKDSLSSALDGCFEVLASLHNQDYVGEIDNLLDFALIMGPPPTLSYENIPRQNDYNEIIQFTKVEEPKDDHDYEEIEMVPLKPAGKKLTDLFFNNNKKYPRSPFFQTSRFSVSTAELCR